MASEDELCCVFCKESFENKDELQIHFRKHGDPKFNQNLKSPTPNDKMSEEGDTVKCDVCAEVFPTISKAITHKHKFHPDHDTKYFCPWCGKLFTMKHLYNKHVESSHSDKGSCEGKGFHCDYCDVNFFVPSAMLYHNKFFHRQDTELAAIGQSRKLKMFNQEPLPIYYCPFCGEEYYNKVNLHKHMGDDHGDENQSPDDVLRCPLCDAIFYHLDAYEVHLTFHSTDDKYTEENELLKGVTEFSLETTPPIMEKVENAEDEEQSMNSIGIESLLQQAMNESADNDNSDLIPERRKKHKKHKKSKKSAITLDEFLNMNKDVFGEGIDFQGIEEVPTQVVAKHLKKPATKIQRAKVIQPASSEIEKLKRQGIVIKKKSHVTPLHFSKQLIQNTTQIKALKVAQMKAAAQKKNDSVSASDVLTKFLSNSQLKIVKKSTTDDTNQEKVDSPNPPGEKSEKHPEEELPDTNEEDKDSVKNEDINKTTSITENLSEESKISDEKTENNKTNKCDETSQKFEHNSQNNEIPNSCKSLENRESEKNCTIKTNISNKTCLKEPISMDSPKHVSRNAISNLTNSNDTNIETDSEKNIVTNEIKTKDSEKFKDTSSLNVLKHLSNLVVKSLNKKTDIEIPDHQETNDDEDSPKKDITEAQPNKKEVLSKYEEQEDKKTESKCLDALKNLSKHLTIKSVSQSVKNCSQKTNPEVNSNGENDKSENDKSENDNLASETEHTDTEDNVAKISVLGNLKRNNSVQQLRSPELKRSPHNSPNRSIKSPQIKEPKLSEQNTKQFNIQNTSRLQTTNLLSNLPNLTAKSVNISKSVQNESLVVKNLYQVNQTIKNTKHKFVEPEPAKEEIEIFNIDDSDDEEVNKQDIARTSSKSAQDSQMESEHKSADIWKNISKQITIKSKNVTQTPKNLESLSIKSNTNNDTSPAATNKTKNIEKQNSVLQNALKNLSKNITIKSNNSKLSERPPSRNSLQNEHYNSDNEPPSKMLAITECHDDDICNKNLDKSEISKNFIVEYPDEEDDSENEHIDGDNDLESEIKANKLKKPVINQKTALSQIKNHTDVNVPDFETDEEDHPDYEEENQKIPNINKECLIKPLKPINALNIDNSQNKNLKEIAHRMTNQEINERTSTASNQVTQEVTVKTIQSKTVVQEITTTVTKTIRTVNQTIKQDVRNSSQASTASPIRPQKIQGMRPQQMRTPPGTIVRQAAPVQGPRIRNPTPQTRPVVRAPVKPCNQLVPVRGGINIVRPNAPRMAGVRRPGPKCSQQQPVMGKPLKISPNAVVSKTTKRPAEETSGPFSCFKKQKESLIPVPDLTEFDSDQEAESSMQYASSHVSKTNFVSSTNTIKGNQIVTTNQMKSEMSATSTQLKKLSNVSGLKIMKTCQSKQTSHVEDTSENSAKRSTIEAIEKLQKQGLLLKKPKVEEEYNSDHTDHEDEDMDT